MEETNKTRITAANKRLASCGVTCLNSSSVFKLGFSAGLKFCDPKSRTNAKRGNVMHHFKTRKTTMNMRINKRLNSFLALFIIFLTACDPGVKYTKVVQNDSDITVYIYPESKVGDGLFYKIDSIRINNHTEASVYEVCELGQTFEYEDC